MNQPKLFIGSASESLNIANALEYELRELKTEIWNNCFEPGQFTLPRLVEKASESDFAAFILGQEDKTKSRGDTEASPRDNVVYEAGLFAGHLGVERVFLLVRTDGEGTKIPTDLNGLVYISYNTADPTEAVHRAAVIIREKITDWKKKVESSLEYQIKGAWWQTVVNSEIGSVLSLMKITHGEDNRGWKVTGEAWNREGKKLAEYWSRATAFDTRDKKLFYYWEGEYPEDATIRKLVGVGEITFKEEQGGSINSARGWFSETDLNQVNDTARKLTRYSRAVQKDLDIMKEENRSEMQKLIDTRR